MLLSREQARQYIIKDLRNIFTVTDQIRWPKEKPLVRLLHVQTEFGQIAFNPPPPQQTDLQKIFTVTDYLALQSPRPSETISEGKIFAKCYTCIK